jgi:hypothetical protein
VPVSETYAERIQTLRESSSNRYICARTGKRFRFESSSSSPSGVLPHPSAGSRRKLYGGKEQS